MHTVRMWSVWELYYVFSIQCKPLNGQSNEWVKKLWTGFFSRTLFQVLQIIWRILLPRFFFHDTHEIMCWKMKKKATVFRLKIMSTCTSRLNGYLDKERKKKKSKFAEKNGSTQNKWHLNKYERKRMSFVYLQMTGSYGNTLK